MSISLTKDKLTIDEVAQVLGLSKSRTYAIIRYGMLRKIETGKRRVYVSVDEVNRYLATYHARRPFSLKD